MTAVEAQEGNTARLDDMAYRVVLFRELNPDTIGDRALLRNASAGDGRSFCDAFLQVCNWGETSVTPTTEIALEDAFGDAYRAVTERLEESLTYTPRSLAPQECLPAPDSLADRTFDGEAVVFEVPTRITQERPLMLEIRDGGERARVVLDL